MRLNKLMSLLLVQQIWRIMYLKEAACIKLINLKLMKWIRGKKVVIIQDILRMVEGILQILQVDRLSIEGEITLNLLI